MQHGILFPVRLLAVRLFPGQPGAECNQRGNQMIRKPSTQKPYNYRMLARQQYRKENDILFQRLAWLLAIVLLVTLCLGAFWIWLIA